MNLERHALFALAAGAVLALGAAGCATYDHGYGATYAGGAATTTQEAQGNRNAVMATIDDQVSRDIQQALRAANGLDARGIRVVALRGHVTLEGTVPSEADHRRAVDIARNTDVDRVVDVTDNLRTSG
jgi:osmotically-inducible protein OsmY